MQQIKTTTSPNYVSQICVYGVDAAVWSALESFEQCNVCIVILLLFRFIELTCVAPPFFLYSIKKFQ